MKMKIIKGYTPIQNSILLDIKISPQARLLLCILIMHCGLDGSCFPSQNTLGKELGYSDRYIRILLNRLINTQTIRRIRSGYNQTNTYWVPEKLLVERDRNSCSPPSGRAIPAHKGSPLPTKSTYLKVKDKSSSKGLEGLRKVMKEKGLIKTSLLKFD